MTSTTHEIYIGIDVSKNILDVFIKPKNHYSQFENNAKGINKLASKLKSIDKQKILIGMEPSGGYEKLVAKILTEKNFAVSVINARWIRDFAKSQGRLAKTDKADAKVIASYCEKMKPEHRVKIDKNHEEITALNSRRDNFINMIVMEKNRLDKVSGMVEKSILRTIKWLENEMNKITKLLEDAIQSDTKYAKRCALIKTIKGVGKTTAAAMVAYFPELGSLENKQAAALAGLAPFNCDSGKHKGKMKVWGGRAAIRTSL